MKALLAIVNCIPLLILISCGTINKNQVTYKHSELDVEIEIQDSVLKSYAYFGHGGELTCKFYFTENSDTSIVLKESARDYIFCNISRGDTAFFNDESKTLRLKYNGEYTDFVLIEDSK